MSAPRAGFDGPPALVPGELRGYRQLRLARDGLRPTVHAGLGPWDGELERAVCGVGGEHAAPAPDCGCGLYGWYHPSELSGAPGEVSAVIAAQGRTVLGDRGFRAARARIEAVTLGPWVWTDPVAAVRARRMLRVRYPRTRVYSSSRRMLRDHPWSDLRELGVAPRPASARRYRRAAAVLWVAGVLACYSVVFLPPGPIGGRPQWVWLVALLGFVAWQAALIALVARAAGGDRPPRR